MSGGALLRGLSASLIAIALSVAGSDGARAFDITKMSMPPEEYKLLQRDAVTTPEARALCAAMGLPATFPCTELSILEAAQQQTDPSLRIDRTIGGAIGSPPPYCHDPVVLERSPGKDGRLALSTIGCHAVAVAADLPPGLVPRLLAAVKRLHEVKPKTLAQHEAEESVLLYLDLLERETK